MSDPNVLAFNLDPSRSYGSEIQARLHPLIDLAARRNLAILAITHRDLRPSSALSHTSRSLLAAARVAHYVGPDPADPTRRLLLPIKNNLGPLAPTLSFSLTDSSLVWHPVDPPYRNSPPSERQLATTWLADQLKSGPLPAADIYDRAKGALIAPITLRRAARDLAINPQRHGFQGPWFWHLPNHDHHCPDDHHCENQPKNAVPSPQ
jgi:hypothetical protein